MDDEELITLSREGDLDAFNRLVERYQTRVYRLAYRMVGPASADDAAQDAFISAFKSLRSFRGGNFRSWLLRITANVCRDQLRASKRKGGASLDEMLEAGAWAPPSTGRSPEEAATDAELNAAIMAAVAALPPDQRAVLVLIDIEGYSYEETAEAVAASLGTVKSRLSRAREKVRDTFRASAELLPAQYRLKE